MVKLRKAFGAPFLMLILTVYGINQGIGSNLQSLATDYYWKDQQKLQPATTQFYETISGIPWDIKPIYGLIADTFPVYGYQRCPYLAICGVASILCLWFLAAIPQPTPWAATMLLTAVALCAAFPDVVTDAMIAQRSREAPALASDLQSLSWGSMAVGGLIGSGISGFAVDSLGSRGSYLLISAAPLLLLLAALALPEARLAKHLQKAKIGALLHTLNLFAKTLRNPAIWKPALYIYLSSGALSPDISEAMFFWSTDPKNGPGFSAQFLGLVNAVGYVAMFLGVAAYNCWFRHYSFRFILCWSQIAGSVIGLIEVILVTRYNHKLGIPDHAFVLGDEVLSDTINRLQLMPILVLSARLCPQGIEGTIFAFLMSVSNFGSTCGSWTGAFLIKWLHIQKDDYRNLWLAVIISSLLRLLPVFFLFLVPEGTDETFREPTLSDAFEAQHESIQLEPIESVDDKQILMSD
ncbi:hypothetical protein O6H91_13G052000 [Diphasiastrum complanatum]|nr:hypothetical protein O6H91_13G052000 [Diphasiastrum complanatum]